MAPSVREYFKACPTDNHRLANYTATQLARAGIENMTLLCDLVENQSEKLLNIRNIGPKSMLVIQMVCAAYRRERGDAG